MTLIFRDTMELDGAIPNFFPGRIQYKDQTRWFFAKVVGRDGKVTLEPIGSVKSSLRLVSLAVTAYLAGDKLPSCTVFDPTMVNYLSYDSIEDSWHPWVKGPLRSFQGRVINPARRWLTSWE